MKKSTQFVISMLFGIIAQFLILSAFAQTDSSKYREGCVLFKLKDNVSITSGAFKQVYQREVDKTQFSFIKKISDLYSVAKVERPFYDADVRDIRMPRIFRMYFNNHAEADAIINELQKMDIIEYAEKEPAYHLTYVPNDEYYLNQVPGFANVGWKWYFDLVNAETAWDIYLNNRPASPNIKVGIVDNAVYTTHEDLADKIVATHNVYDGTSNCNPVSNTYDWSHGTHVAGLAAADFNNGLGMPSIGVDNKIVAVRITNNLGGIVNVPDGIYWAADNGANIINMSFTSTTGGSTLQDAVNYAYNTKGCILVAAAGNEGNTTINYPCACTNVICVGAVNSNDQRASFSDYGSQVDIAAPGGQNTSYNCAALSSTACLSSAYGSASAPDLTPLGIVGNYHLMVGTSMATPMVSGLAGLMWSLNPNLTNSQITNLLVSTAHNIGSQQIGPRMDAAAAMQAVLNTVDVKEKIKNSQSAHSINIYPNPSNGLINIYFNSGKNPILVKITGIDGKKVIERSFADNNKNNSIQFDMTTYPAGLYNVTLMFDDYVISKNINIIK
ncbi:MAG: S8 family serine peptidase [Bacteroidales bacterium]